jgi:hypothetical protein
MRILKIEKYIKPDYFGENCRFGVFDENGQDLQGIINVENLDEIKCTGFPETNKYNGGYFVYNPAESKPKKIYETYEEAYKDARELAARYDDVTFYVLQIITQIKREKFIKTNTVDREGHFSETFDNDQVPF